MLEENLGFVVFAVILVFIFVVRPIWSLWRDRSTHLKAEADKDRAEAMFKTMFPELQPHFHPERVDEYVFARLEQPPPKGTFVWNDPAGFPAAASATLAPDPKGERTILKDAARNVIAEFLFESRPDGGGVIRLGKGKLTATRDHRGRPSVRYWHPDREFKWKPPKDWSFTSRMAEEPISTTEHGSSFSSDSSSSSARTAATAAGLAGLGGTFDGGGASGAWDDRGASADAASSSSSTASDTSY